VLAGRATYQSGSVTINNAPLAKDMKRAVGYVMQSDLFFDHLTVRASLTYTALLRLPGAWSHEQKIEEVT
jgi:ABC-type multidrug transport system ATPase subunit